MTTTSRRTHARVIPPAGSRLSAAATVSGTAKIVRHQVPSDMGALGLNTRSM